MVCPSCGIEAKIDRSRTEVTGDISETTQTRVFTVLSFVCRNPNCAKYRSDVGESRVEIYPKKGGESE